MKAFEDMRLFNISIVVSYTFILLLKMNKCSKIADFVKLYNKVGFWIRYGWIRRRSLQLDVPNELNCIAKIVNPGTLE